MRISNQNNDGAGCEQGGKGSFNLVILTSTQNKELCHTYVYSRQRTLTDLLLSKTVSFSVNILKMGVKWISVKN
jgi:hypothetical protein